MKFFHNVNVEVAYSKKGLKECKTDNVGTEDNTNKMKVVILNWKSKKNPINIIIKSVQLSVRCHNMLSLPLIWDRPCEISTEL